MSHTCALIAHLFFCRTALILYSTLQTGSFLVFRSKDLGLAVLPNRAPVKVMSRAFLSRLAVRRLRRCSYHRASIGSSSKVDERHILGMLASPLITQKRGECGPSRIYHSNRDTLHRVQGNLWRCTHATPSQAEIQKVLGVFFQERIFAECPDIRDFLELRTDHAAQGEQAALRNVLSEA